MKKIKKHNQVSILSYIVLVLFSLIVLYPLAWMVLTSLKTLEETFVIPPVWLPEHPSLKTYGDIFVKYPIAAYFRNSVIVVVVTTAVSVIVSCLAGYAASRSRSRFKKPFMTFLLVLQMFPAVMLLVPYYKMLTAYRLVDTLPGLILPNIAFTMPFCTWMMKGYFDSISPTIDEAAMVDGAGRWKKMIYITLPSIVPTVIILLIMRIGWLLSVGFEKVLLMYNEATYEVADVISTYIYRASLLNADFSYGTAIGLFNCVISLVLVLGANWVSRRFSETSLF